MQPVGVASDLGTFTCAAPSPEDATNVLHSSVSGIPTGDSSYPFHTAHAIDVLFRISRCLSIEQCCSLVRTTSSRVLSEGVPYDGIPRTNARLRHKRNFPV
jgi:hypothetical protein